MNHGCLIGSKYGGVEKVGAYGNREDGDDSFFKGALFHSSPEKLLAESTCPYSSGPVARAGIGDHLWHPLQVFCSYWVKGNECSLLGAKRL